MIWDDVPNPKGVFFTGHRPHGLWGQHFFNHSKEVRAKHDAQRNTLAKVVGDLMILNFNLFITGGAIGLDQMAAETVADLRDTKYPRTCLVIAKPFPSQDAVWPPRIRDDFARICRRADNIINVCDDPYEPYKMQVRNQWMVDRAMLGVAMWSGSRGGTANCVQYATKQRKPIIVIHPHTLAITTINC